MNVPRPAGAQAAFDFFRTRTPGAASESMGRAHASGDLFSVSHNPAATGTAHGFQFSGSLGNPSPFDIDLKTSFLGAGIRLDRVFLAVTRNHLSAKSVVDDGETLGSIQFSHSLWTLNFSVQPFRSLADFYVGANLKYAEDDFPFLAHSESNQGISADFGLLKQFRIRETGDLHFTLNTSASLSNFTDWGVADLDLSDTDIPTVFGAGVSLEVRNLVLEEPARERVSAVLAVQYEDLVNVAGHGGVAIGSEIQLFGRYAARAGFRYQEGFSGPYSKWFSAGLGYRFDFRKSNGALPAVLELNTVTVRTLIEGGGKAQYFPDFSLGIVWFFGTL